ncbi:MAG: hypothetical protein PHP92_03955 [Candidatus Nanoarchaeia archaeon]|nr:hypothetical protein [Candidatus Nanoarchaeia archaeon]
MELTTSKNIMMTHKSNYSVMYNHQCDCGDPTHQIQIDVSQDDDIPNIILITLYANLTAMNHKRNNPKIIWDKLYNICQEIKWRTKNIMDILFHGRISGNEAFIIQGEDSINDYIKALNEALKWIKKNKWSDKKI